MILKEATALEITSEKSIGCRYLKNTKTIKVKCVFKVFLKKIFFLLLKNILLGYN